MTSSDDMLAFIEDGVSAERVKQHAEGVESVEGIMRFDPEMEREIQMDMAAQKKHSEAREASMAKRGSPSFLRAISSPRGIRKQSHTSPRANGGVFRDLDNMMQHTNASPDPQRKDSVGQGSPGFLRAAVSRVGRSMSFERKSSPAK